MSDIGRRNRVVKDLSENGLRRDQRLFYRDPVAFLKRYDVKGFDDGSDEARAASGHFRRNTRARTAANPFRSYNAPKARGARANALARGRAVRAANLAAARQQRAGNRQQRAGNRQQRAGNRQQGGFWW
jgi:hypothetical protein